MAKKKKEKKSLNFVGQIQEMAESQVTSHIGGDRMSAIKDRDPHPMFIGLDVAYEGVSGGEVRGHGNQQKVWMEGAVKGLALALNQGDIGLYDAHVKEGADRNRMGDVLSGFSGEEEGLLHAYGVGYVKPDGPYRAHIQEGKLDGCSVEAAVQFELTPDGAWIVQGIQEATGVAVINSTFQQPGFSGAGVVAVIQELEKEEEDMEPTEEEIQQAVQKMTSEKIRTLISGTSLTPSQLFTADQLQNDTGVKQISSQLETDLSSVRQKLTAAEAENVTLKKDAVKGTVASTVAEKVGELKGLEEGEKAHITKNLMSQDFSGADDLGKAVDEAVQLQAQEINSLRSIYGKEEKVSGAPAEDDKQEEKKEEGGDTKVAEDDPFLAANKATATGELVEV